MIAIRFRDLTNNNNKRDVGLVTNTTNSNTIFDSRLYYKTHIESREHYIIYSFLDSIRKDDDETKRNKSIYKTKIPIL